MNYETGTVVGDYQIVGVLGTGGMGKVYKVRNTISDRIEAMKILLPNLDADHELAERFLREIKVQASLQHPNIASLRTAQRVNNQLLMIMEFVEGSTIESMMRDHRIPLPECVNYGSQVLSALAYAHAHGVVHRDIKPPNIMLTPEGVVKLMDFGIAKIGVDHRLTQAGKTVGSLFYMSPEQIRGTDVDGRSDLYSFGITLYEMVTGRRPFEGESDYSIMAAHLQQPPQPPVYFDASLPQVLNDVILMSIAKDPAERFQTAEAFRAALESVGKGLGVGAATASSGTQIFSRPVLPPSPPAPPSAPHRTPTLMETPPSQPQIPVMPPPPQFAQPPQYAQAPQMPSVAPMPQIPPQYAQTSGGRSHRGMYMVLGSVITVGILIGAAFYVPKLLKTRASGGSTQTAQVQPPGQPQPPAPVQQTPGQPAPEQQPPAQPPQAQQPPVQQPVAPPPAVEQQPAPRTAPPKQIALGRPKPQTPASPPPVAPVAAPPQTQPVQQPQAPAAPPPSMPQPSNAAPPANPVNSELDELHHRQMLMRARIEAMNASMSQLEQQQRRMGLGMNGQLVASQHRMVYFMETADAAMRNGNIAQARTSLDNAERELGKLEEHFGR